MERDDIPRTKDVRRKVWEAHKERPEGSHLIFGHSGIMHLILRRFGLIQLYVENCGMISYKVGDDGRPNELLNYWNPPKTNL